MPTRGRGTRSTKPKLVPPYTPRKSGRDTRPTRRTKEANEANTGPILPPSPPPGLETPTREPRLPPPCPPPPKRTDKSGLLAKKRLSATQLLELRRKDPTRDKGSTNGIVNDVGVQQRTELARKVQESYQEALD